MAKDRGTCGQIFMKSRQILGEKEKGESHQIRTTARPSYALPVYLSVDLHRNESELHPIAVPAGQPRLRLTVRRRFQRNQTQYTATMAGTMKETE